MHGTVSWQILWQMHIMLDTRHQPAVYIGQSSGCQVIMDGAELLLICAVSAAVGTSHSTMGLHFSAAVQPLDPLF